MVGTAVVSDDGVENIRGGIGIQLKQELFHYCCLMSHRLSHPNVSRLLQQNGVPERAWE